MGIERRFGPAAIPFRSMTVKLNRRSIRGKDIAQSQGWHIQPCAGDIQLRQLSACAPPDSKSSGRFILSLSILTSSPSSWNHLIG